MLAHRLLQKPMRARGVHKGILRSYKDADDDDDDYQLPLRLLLPLLLLLLLLLPGRFPCSGSSSSSSSSCSCSCACSCPAPARAFPAPAPAPAPSPAPAAWYCSCSCSCSCCCCYFHRRSSRAPSERPRGELDGGEEADGPASCMYSLQRRTAIEKYTAGAAAAAATTTTTTIYYVYEAQIRNPPKSVLHWARRAQGCAQGAPSNFHQSPIPLCDSP